MRGKLLLHVAALAAAWLFVSHADGADPADGLPGTAVAEPSAHGAVHAVRKDGEIPLPGTQPFQHGAPFGVARSHAADSDLGTGCQSCHGHYDSAPKGSATPESNGAYDGWRGTMMAQAWRDPVFRAALAVANRDLEDAAGVPAGDWCTRCHAPAAWFEGQSVPADGSAIGGAGAEGIQCAVCHRMLDAVAATADCDPRLPHEPFDCGGPSFSGRVTGYDNAELVIDPGHSGAEVLHGPYDDPGSPHASVGGDGEFVRRSDHCGSCHNVTNPVKRVPSAEELRGARPEHLARSHAAIAGEPVPIERTHAEWVASAFPAEGVRCQTCHFPPARGYAAIDRRALREELPVHDTAGGNAWVPDLIPIFFPDQATSAMRDAFERVKQSAGAMLRTAAGLSIERFEPGLLVVRVDNRTGHKLPTGYPEGRRMWLHVEGFANGGRVFESGAYDEETGVLSASDGVGRPTKVWEILLGTYDRERREAIPGFHFALNDVIVKDNRIPPQGFRIAEGARAGVLLVRDPADCAPPVPQELAQGCESFDWQGKDGVAEGYDVVAYALPSGIDRVRVALRYQTSSSDYVEFLGDPRHSGAYADRFVAGLPAAWSATRRSAPVEMASVEASRD